MDNHLFTKNLNIKPIKWAVQGLIPEEDIGIIGAKPGVGKSFFVEQLATCTAYDKPFLGFDVAGGNVLIIDEDTPTATLDRRLSKFANYYKCDRKYNLWRHSKEGLRMDDGSASGVINSYDNLKLVIIDCLVSVSGKADLDKTSDTKVFDSFKQEIKREGLTILINHHISTKDDIQPIDLMTCQNPEGLIMNNTRIVSTCDSLYIVASPDVDGILRTLLVRPKGRRNTLPIKTFSSILYEDDSEMHFEYGEKIDPTKSLTEDEKYLLSSIEPAEEFIVLNIVERAGKMFVEQRIRDMLNSLRDKGYLQRLAREGRGGKLKLKRIL